MQILCLVLEIVLGLYEVTLSHASPMASTVNITTPTPFATSLARCHLFVPTTASLLWYHLPSCNQREGNLWCHVAQAPHVLPPAPTIILVRLQAAEPSPPPTACQGTCGTQDKLNPSKLPLFVVSTNTGYGWYDNILGCGKIECLLFPKN